MPQNNIEEYVEAVTPMAIQLLSLKPINLIFTKSQPSDLDNSLLTQNYIKIIHLCHYINKLAKGRLCCTLTFRLYML